MWRKKYCVVSGAKPEEVSLMNGLTVNLHLLMVPSLMLLFVIVRYVRPKPQHSDFDLMSSLRSSPSTNRQRLDTESSWRTKPFLRTTWGSVFRLSALQTPFTWCKQACFLGWMSTAALWPGSNGERARSRALPKDKPSLNPLKIIYYVLFSSARAKELWCLQQDKARGRDHRSR